MAHPQNIEGKMNIILSEKNLDDPVSTIPAKGSTPAIDTQVERRTLLQRQ